MAFGVNDGAVQADPVARLGSSLEASQNLWPFLIYALSVVALLAVTLIVARLISDRTRHTDATDLPFESGVVPVGSAADGPAAAAPVGATAAAARTFR